MNVLREYRIKFGYTQKQLGMEVGMSPKAILRYEQGLYANPSQKIVQFLAEVLAEHEYTGSEWSSDTIEDLIIQRYHDFRIAKQRSNQLKISPGTHRISLPYTGHPFKIWRSTLLGSPSRMKFCILLAINPAVVLEYEKGTRPNMPPMIREALKNANFTKFDINYLNEVGLAFHRKVRKSHVSG